MAKKETTKKSTTKKPTTKKAISKEKELEIQKEVFMETLKERKKEISEDTDTIDTQVMNGDPSVIVPVEEDATNVVLDAIGETIEKVVEAPVELVKEIANETEKIENKIARKINKEFGYSWNGQEIDF